MDSLRAACIVGVLGAMLSACGSAKPSAPLSATDTTEGDAPRTTTLPTCRWVPSLPGGREDPCEQINNGSELSMTDREGMRGSAETKTKHICLCQ